MPQAVRRVVAWTERDNWRSDWVAVLCLRQLKLPKRVALEKSFRQQRVPKTIAGCLTELGCFPNRLMRQQFVEFFSQLLLQSEILATRVALKVAPQIFRQLWIVLACKSISLLKSLNNGRKVYN